MRKGQVLWPFFSAIGWQCGRDLLIWINNLKHY